jgi:SAM-dependent methyltransferase
MLSVARFPFAFVHIPKTGGTSVEQALVCQLLDRPGFELLSRAEATQFALPGGDRIAAEIPACAGCAERFANASLRRVAPQEVQHESVAYFEERGLLEKRFVFTVVRNPFARALSEVFFLRLAVPESHGLFHGRSWRDDLIALAGFDGCVGHDLGACQVDWLLDSAGRVRADRILRQEHLLEDWELLCADLGLAPGVLPRKMVSPRWGHWSEYYDEVTAEMIARKYARDFEAFGYSPDISSHRPPAVRGFKGLEVGVAATDLPGWIAGNRHYQAGRHLVPDSSLDAVYVGVLGKHPPNRAVELLQECRRMLKPGGVLRLATRDLGLLARLAAEGDDPEIDEYLTWYFDKWLPEAPFAAPAFVINDWLRRDEFAYFYDEGLLVEVLHEAGFQKVYRLQPGTGSCPELCGLETSHGDGGLYPLEWLIIEAPNES